MTPAKKFKTSFAYIMRIIQGLSGTHETLSLKTSNNNKKKFVLVTCELVSSIYKDLELQNDEIEKLLFKVHL